MNSGESRIRPARKYPSITGESSERAARAMARLEDFTRLITEWIWEIDQDGVLTFVSGRVHEVLGFLPVQLIGQRLPELATPVPSPQTPKHLTWQMPFRELPMDILDAKGNVRRHLVSGIPFYHPTSWRFEGVYGTARDVTDMVHSHQALSEANRQLKEANAAKSEFLASMSHELRTPLNSILGFSGMISNEVLGPIGHDGYIEYAEDIAFSGENLLGLVNQVLDIERIEAGKFDLEKEEFILADVLEECERLLKKRAEDSGISLSFDIARDMPPLRADRRAVFQVLVNTLANAIKFTPDGGRVDVRARETERWNVIEIRDTGFGIPDEKLAVIKQPFTRHKSNPHLSQDGVGLGLTIANALVELHDGALDINSKVGAGTTVRVELPIAS